MPSVRTKRKHIPGVGAELDRLVDHVERGGFEPGLFKKLTLVSPSALAR